MADGDYKRACQGPNGYWSKLLQVSSCDAIRVCFRSGLGLFLCYLGYASEEKVCSR